MLGADAYKTGIARNISDNGALLWLKEDLAVGSGLELRMESNGEQQYVYMRMVRTEETNRAGYMGYGCKVDMIISEAA